MKYPPGTIFCEQVSAVNRLFSDWNVCEQTVVLFALLRRIPSKNARFLAQAVLHTLHALTHLDTLEVNANNPGYIKSLMMERTDIAVAQLLEHLLLLRPGNTECKQIYLVAIPELVNHCLTTGECMEQTQQLLSYTLIHPAITAHDRRELSQWLRQLEDRISAMPPAPGLEDYPNKYDNAWFKNLKQNDQTSIFSIEQPGGSSYNLQYPSPISRQRRSNSLTPIAPSHHHNVVERTSNANSSRHKPRSFSVSGDHASNFVGLGPLSPQSSCASSGSSEGRIEDASNRSLASGMRDVPAWLKTLRLHKYSYLFVTLSYEDMLQLTEDQLAEQGVTKGARHKLALSIIKLHQRYNTLLNLEKDLLQPTHEGLQTSSYSHGSALLVNTVEELKTILVTPMKPSQESDLQDIPTQFIKVLGKLCSKLALENADDGILSAYISVLEKVLQHDCFTQSQKEKVQQWRSRLGNPRPTPKWQHNYLYNRRYGNQQQRKQSLNMSHIHNNHTHNNHSFMANAHRNSISTPYLQSNQNQSLNQSNVRTIHVAEKRPSLQEPSMQHLQKPLQRTYSAPRDHFPRQIALVNANETTEPEIDSRLQSLCIRMTEQAIGGSEA